MLKGKTTIEGQKRKLTVGDSALVFTKDLEISFLDGLDIGRFRIAKDAMSPYQSTFCNKTIVASFIKQEQIFLIFQLWFLLTPS